MTTILAALAGLWLGLALGKMLTYIDIILEVNRERNDRYFTRKR